MSSITVPVSFPVKISAQDSNITFTQNDDGYFMNLDLKLELPIKDLVDSLMKCGDQIRDEFAILTNAVATPQLDAAARDAVVGSVSDSGSTSCGNGRSSPSYCSVPFPRIDSPYRTRGKWQSERATYFLREHKSAAQSPPTVGKRQLSPNAPIFTPLSLRESTTALPNPSPFTQCSLAASEGVWDLPGLPSPIVECSQDPALSMYSSHAPAAPQQSILQRGLSNQCRQM